MGDPMACGDQTTGDRHRASGAATTADRQTGDLRRGADPDTACARGRRAAHRRRHADPTAGTQARGHHHPARLAVAACPRASSANHRAHPRRADPTGDRRGRGIPPAVACVPTASCPSRHHRPAGVLTAGHRDRQTASGAATTADRRTGVRHRVGDPSTGLRSRSPRGASPPSPRGPAGLAPAGRSSPLRALGGRGLSHGFLSQPPPPPRGGPDGRSPRSPKGFGRGDHGRSPDGRPSPRGRSEYRLPLAVAAGRAARTLAAALAWAGRSGPGRPIAAVTRCRRTRLPLPRLFLPATTRTAVARRSRGSTATVAEGFGPR